MNDNERSLLEMVCDGDIRKSQQQAKIILNSMSSQKDQMFRDRLLRKLEAKGPTLIELPYNLQDLLIAEDVTVFPDARFLLRENEAHIVQQTLATLKASERLAELGINYLPAVMLYGESGGGKTMLARYIAHKADKLFVYVRFSNIVNSKLGSTQANIAKVFDYARISPCVLCFDEIDALGMARGQENDVAEMNRVVITLMQEMDRMPNNVILVGTTNRYDQLDPALTNRFSICHEVQPLRNEEILVVAKRFYQYAGVSAEDWLEDWCQRTFTDEEPARVVTRKCTEKLVMDALQESENSPTTDKRGEKI